MERPEASTAPIKPGAADAPLSLRMRFAQLAATTDGTATVDGLLDAPDRVAAFNPAILVIRWSTTLAALALSIQQLADGNAAVAVWCGVLLAYTVVRTNHPIRYVGTIRSLIEILGEVVFHVLAVVTTGYWDSPFLFSLLTAVIVAGFARGFGFAMRIGLVSGMAVGIPYLLAEPVTNQRVQYTAGWMLVLLMVGLIAGYARRISGEADRQHSLALDRLGRLADANSLLFSLHRVTQTLPASLDLGDVLDTTIGRLRGLFEFDTAAVLVHDETDGVWQLVRREGARLPSRLDDGDLPPPVRRVVDDLSVILVPDLTESNGPGLAPKASSGLYAVLTARGATIGALVIESSAPGRFSGRDLELLQGFVEPVALAIDNARWFARLRTVGADEERTRIARDLHDRIGQSLAYLAFELDRIVAGQSNGADVGPSLERLRDDVRGVIREVRDTLYDLRTDVSDSADLPTILEQFAARIHERAELSFDLVLDNGSRLPILQEREMWRIAQEAITNIERHAEASHVRVVWRCNGEAAALDITDDGRGFPSGTAGRLDSYGILGMRERASSIGATLAITSEANKGTRVRCTLLPATSAEHNKASGASAPRPSGG